MQRLPSRDFAERICLRELALRAKLVRANLLTFAICLRMFALAKATRVDTCHANSLGLRGHVESPRDL